jgi:hypothetical protein
MCRAVSEPLVVEVRSGSALRAARKIVRKYRRREERKEIEKLRRLLPAAGASQLKRQEVIDHTIDLIVSLEQQLLAKIRAEGRLPSLLAHTGLAVSQREEVSLESLRTAMSTLLPQRRRPQHQHRCA